MPSSTREFATDSERARTAPSSAPAGDRIAAATPALGAARRSRPWWIDVWVQIVRRKPLGTIGAAIVVLMLAGAVLADVIAPYGYAQTSLRDRFVAVSAAHWLGTDQLG